eukprot:gene7004-10801_t
MEFSPLHLPMADDVRALSQASLMGPSQASVVAGRQDGEPAAKQRMRPRAVTKKLIQTLVRVKDKSDAITAAPLTGDTAPGMSIGVRSGAVVEQFASDGVLGDAKDHLVRHMVDPLVDRLWFGHDSCVIVYGHERTGKSRFIEEDTPDGGGLIPALCQEIVKRKKSEPQCAATLSFFEVQRDKIVDLLADKDSDNPDSVVSLLVDQDSGYMDLEGLCEHDLDDNAPVSTAIRKGRAAALKDAEEAPPDTVVGLPYAPEHTTQPLARKRKVGGSLFGEVKKPAHDHTCAHTVFRVVFTRYVRNKRTDTRIDVVDTTADDDSIRNMISTLSTMANGDFSFCLPFRQSLMTRMLTKYFAQKDSESVVFVAAVSGRKTDLEATRETLSIVEKARSLRQSLGDGSSLVAASSEMEKERTYRKAVSQLHATQSLVFRLENELKMTAGDRRLEKHRRILAQQESEDLEARVVVVLERMDDLKREHAVQRAAETRRFDKQLRSAATEIADLQRTVASLQGQLGSANATVDLLREDRRSTKATLEHLSDQPPRAALDGVRALCE